MNIYKLSQTMNDDYDTYDSCIVCAESKAEAILIHPSEFVKFSTDKLWMGVDISGNEYETQNRPCATWAERDRIQEIKIEKIGVADKSQKKGVILASFNAG